MHGQGIAMNYYPPCPKPELTYGLPSHTNPSVITILLTDNVPGLQFLKNGKWVNINPVPKTFVVNIGDIVQVNYFIYLLLLELNRPEKEQNGNINHLIFILCLIV